MKYFRSEAFCGETHSALRYVFGDVHGEYMFINGLRFLVTYFINTTLLVIIHIKYTKKWAAGYNPPLRSGKRTNRIYIYITIKKRTSAADSFIYTIICEEFSMRNA